MAGRDAAVAVTPNQSGRAVCCRSRDLEQPLEILTCSGGRGRRCWPRPNRQQRPDEYRSLLWDQTNVVQLEVAQLRPVAERGDARAQPNWALGRPMHSNPTASGADAEAWSSVRSPHLWDCRLVANGFHEHPRVAMTNSVPNSGRDSTRPPGPATDRYRGDVVAVQRGTPHQTEPNRDGSRQPEYPEISSNPAGTSSFRNLTLSAVAAASSGKMRPSTSGPTVPATLSSGLAAARVPVSALCLDRACRTPSITQPQGFETPQWPGARERLRPSRVRTRLTIW